MIEIPSRSAWYSSDSSRRPNGILLRLFCMGLKLEQLHRVHPIESHLRPATQSETQFRGASRRHSCASAQKSKILVAPQGLRCAANPLRAGGREADRALGLSRISRQRRSEPTVRRSLQRHRRRAGQAGHAGLFQISKPHQRASPRTAILFSLHSTSG